MTAFRAIAREARAWLKEPSDARMIGLVSRAGEAAASVPEARRVDWETLVAGFAKTEAIAKRRARVEGLVRACALFAEKRATRSNDGPISWGATVDAVPGLGPASRDALAALGVRHVGDLVWTLPVRWDDRRAPTGVREAIESVRASGGDARVCVHGVVKAAGFVPMRGRRAVRIVVADADDPKATIHAWWFFTAHGVIAAAKVGVACLLVGRVRVDPGKPPRTAHPDFAIDDPSARIVRPRYPRLGVAEASLRKAIGVALDRIDEIPDPVPRVIVTREEMRPVQGLLRAVHGASGVLEAPPDDDSRRALVERLAWGEAFTRAWQRLEAIERQGEGAAPVLPIDRAVAARIRAELGFALTKGQTKAIDAIAHDLARTAPMRRLLLGDVGTGKTAVALAAAAQCVAAKRQVAILAPTSVLAEQYLDAAAPLARATGASITLIAAGLPAAQRRRAEEGLAKGTIDVAIGTHALLREGVTFARLGLAIVDEQQRLGVAQRLALVQKGTRPHLLALSATPIPRTMALALRGELATSTLDERPKGRPPVATEARPRSDWAEIVEELRALCKRGERAFVVSPRIDDAEDEEEERAGAETLAARLTEVLAPAKVVLVHGGLAPDARRKGMRALRTGEAQVLVGTTVIEVGVDVPEATWMIIDGAERFGLAQLHQLRGRVGRGDRPGRCTLLHDDPVDPRAEKRLRALCEISSGMEIARIDLQLRGAGDLGGTRQHGVEEDLLYLDPASPPAWLARIDADARSIFKSDRPLAKPEHRALAQTVERLATAIAVREEAG